MTGGQGESGGGRPSPAAGADKGGRPSTAAGNAAAREDARPPLAVGDNRPPAPQRRRPSRHSVVVWPRSNRPVILFVTVATHGRQPAFASALARDAVLKAWDAARNWIVGRYVFMPDHVHFFCAPGAWPIPDFHRWMQYWKRLSTQTCEGRPFSAAGDDRAARGNETARGDARSPSAVGDDRPPKLWQDGCWDTQIRCGNDYAEKWAYVRMNPVRKGLVAHADEWPWQGEVHVLRWHD